MAVAGTCERCGGQVPPGSRFCPRCGAPQSSVSREHMPPAGPAGTASPSPPEGQPQEASDQLRPITALFADVVGSTSLGERLPPDEVKALIGECVSRMSRAVEEFGGTVQAYMGDGIASYFGIPTAHEDDPERAARAALRILEVVGEYAHDIHDAWGISEFSVRVGINTGMVGAGMVGASNPQQVGLGDATNVAARLQSAAEPGTVAVGETAARLLSPRFVLESMGEVTVKGRGAAVAAWRLVGPRGEEEPGSRPPLVGREAEVARLRSVVDELLAGRGQVVSVVGEVGIGKTRLLEELRSLAAPRASWLDGASPSYGGDPYAPFVEMLRAWLGVGEADAEVAVRTRLRARMTDILGGRVDEVLPYLGLLLGVRLEPDVEADVRQTQPDVLARHLRAAYRLWVEALCAERPVVIALDDLHWADRSTGELAEDLLELTDRAPLLVVAALRPDPASEGWRFRLKVLAAYPHRSVEVPLGPLPEEAAGELAAALVPGGKLDQWTRQALVQRSEGNPLYLEEMLRTLMESGALERRRTWTLTVSHQAPLPPALEGLLVARIDRLPAEARTLLQTASVIGRDFPARVLERVAGRDGTEQQIAILLRADVIRELRRYPEIEYTFKHGLLQEAALSTLAPPTRRELYGRVAAAFEELFADSIEEHLPRLAHYYALSRDRRKALDYLERAAERAASIDAGEQAAQLWSRALKVARHLENDEAVARVEERLRASGVASA